MFANKQAHASFLVLDGHDLNAQLAHLVKQVRRCLFIRDDVREALQGAESCEGDLIPLTGIEYGDHLVSNTRYRLGSRGDTDSTFGRLGLYQLWHVVAGRGGAPASGHDDGGACRQLHQ